MDGSILDVRKLSREFQRVAEDAKQCSLDQVSEAFQRVRGASEVGSTTTDTVERPEAELRRELEVISKELMCQVSETSRGAIAGSVRLGGLASSMSLGLPANEYAASTRRY